MRKINKKVLAVITVVAIFVGGTGVFAANSKKWVNPLNSNDVIQQVNYPIYVNGVKLDMKDPETGSQQVVINYDGRTYIALRKVAESVGADSEAMWDSTNPQNPHIDIIKSLPKDFIQINIFPNGYSVKEATQTNTAITNKAKQLVGNTKSKTQKARIIYDYIRNNYEYQNTGNVGAIACFNSKKGICYDFSCLYAVMCDSVNVNVRIVGGLAYQTEEDAYSYPTNHAWNQAMNDEGNWLAIDCTFGNPTANGNDSLGWDFQEIDIEKDGLSFGDRIPTWMFLEYMNY